MPTRRPNTMNNYGIIVNEIGLGGFMTVLLERYMSILARYLFPNEAVSYGLDHHHSFIVQYKSTYSDSDKGKCEICVY